MDWVNEATGERIASFGGVWDREEKRFVDGLEAKRRRVIRLHAGQIDFAEWFRDWLAGHLAGDVAPNQRIYDALMMGGRRGGKTVMLFLALVAYAIAIPDSICGVYVPSDAFYGEPIKMLEGIILPIDWYTSLGSPWWCWYIANGSTIQMFSANTARRQKQGTIDFCALNEAQSIPNDSYGTLSASIIDHGGLVLSAANPPDVGDKGEWVADLAVKADRGDLPHARYFFFDPEDNPHIDQTALRALRFKMDQHTYDVQVRGKILNRPDTVCYNWDRRENEKHVPQIGECTRQFTKYFEGREYSKIVGVDVQNFPWIASIVWQAFRNPLAPDDMELAFLWGVGEIFVDQGDEIVCATRLRRDLQCGFDSTLVIMDASCDWQQQERSEDKQRPEFKGRGSMDMFRGVGFQHVVPPDPYMRDNPEIMDRVRAMQARICNEANQRFIFVDPERCPKTCESIKKWKTKADGKPSRHSRAAHGGDVIGYVNWRFFPRRKQSDSVGVQTVKRFQGPNRLKGF